MSEGLEVHPPRDLGEIPEEQQPSWGRELVKSIDDGYFLEFTAENLITLEQKVRKLGRSAIGRLRSGS